MIRISKGQANAVVVTLNEKGTASHYLFEFYSHTTNAYHYAVQQDTSANVERYNQFELTETTSPVAVDGEVECQRVNTNTRCTQIQTQLTLTRQD
jgi:hypothetical protein